MVSRDPLQQEAVRYARAVTKYHGKTFYFASLFLPRPMRHAIWTFYAYTRGLDDLVDESPLPSLAGKQLRLLDRSLARRVENPGSSLIDRGLSHAIREFEVPIFYFHALAAGLRMDLERRSYKDWGELYRYCWRVASVVGLMVSRTFGKTDPATFKRVVECGIAMQLTNILRDVGEDLEQGRIYLPRDDMERFGVTETMLARREPTDPIRALLAFEIARARGYYASGSRVLGHVRGRVRMTAALAVRLYGRILDKIEENDYDVFTRRASVPLLRKLAAVPPVVLSAWLPIDDSGLVSVPPKGDSPV